VRRAARDDLASFSADVRELEPAGSHPAAAEAYRAALSAYERAELACDRAGAQILGRAGAVARSEEHTV